VKISLNGPVIGKTLMAGAAAAVAALQPYYGTQHWYVALVLGLGALGVGVSESHTPGGSGGA